MIRNLICISDTHCGDQLGLCPPTVTLAHGGTYHASSYQAAVWDHWHHFWHTWVPKVTRGEPYAVVLNGDMVEGRHHGATHQISADLADQNNIAYECLAPIIDLCQGRFYYISGTPVHAGEAGEDEERLARRLGAIPTEGGRSTRYELYINVGQALVHTSHHIGVTSSGAYETSALAREFNEFCSESSKWGRPPPDILVRSHRHRHCEIRVPTHRGYGIIFVTSAWQLKTPFLFKVPGGRVSTPNVGGSLIRQGDEEFYTRHYTVETARSRTEEIPLETV
jgi:hypothetical protein